MCISCLGDISIKYNTVSNKVAWTGIMGLDGPGEELSAPGLSSNDSCPAIDLFLAGLSSQSHSMSSAQICCKVFLTSEIFSFLDGKCAKFCFLLQ